MQKKKIIYVAVTVSIVTLVAITLTYAILLSERSVYIWKACEVVSKIEGDEVTPDLAQFPLEIFVRGHQGNVVFQRKYVDNEIGEQKLYFVVAVVYKLPFWMFADAMQTEITKTNGLIEIELLQSLNVENARVNW